MSLAIERPQHPPDSFVIRPVEENSQAFLRLDGQPPELDQPDISLSTGGLIGISGAEIEAWPRDPGDTRAEAKSLLPEQLAIVCLEAVGVSQPQICSLTGRGRNFIERRKLAACKTLSIDLIPHYDQGRLPQDRLIKELIKGMYSHGLFVPRELPDISDEDRLFLMEVGPHLLSHDKRRDSNYAIAEGRRAYDPGITPSKVEWEFLRLRQRLGADTSGLVTLFLAYKFWKSEESN